VFTTSGTYPWSFVTQIFHDGHDGDRKTFAVIGSVASLLAETCSSWVRPVLMREMWYFAFCDYRLQYTFL